jgi:hypothetical protein
MRCARQPSKGVNYFLPLLWFVDAASGHPFATELLDSTGRGVVGDIAEVGCWLAFGSSAALVVSSGDANGTTITT